jgi:branched-chain amino acid transport system substrate-binding protein
LPAVRRACTFAALGAALVVALVACGGDEKQQGGELLVVVNAPFSRSSALGETLAHGAELAAAQVNARGGVVVGDKTYRLRVRRLDNAYSTRRAVENVRRAVADRAIAVVDEGRGVNASWQIANRADLPIGIVHDGGAGLVDVDERPNVFRIAPRDRGIAFRLAEYLVPKGLRVALLHDDTGYGRQGEAAIAEAFERNPEAVGARIALPSSAGDLAPQVLKARRAGANALLVWAEAPAIAKVLFAARSSGWNVPVFTSPTGADPLVRQQLADHPRWIDGLTFASGRMTAEVGPGPWQAFQSAYEQAWGPQRVGVTTAAGRPVTQPPEFAMYAYDFVNVLAAALTAAGTADDRSKLLEALEQVTVQGANGDERGFNERSHEGVVDDDVYFARFRDMTFRPVKDDPLSSTLPVIPQEL